MAYPSILRIPRPRTFLYLMSLRTGTELITLSVLINKLSGLYGLLAILTGVHLSPLQLSMYIYSVIALALTAYLAPHIRKQSPLQCIALAWLYLLDSLVNAAYTAAFGVSWFLVLAQHNSPLAPTASSPQVSDSPLTSLSQPTASSPPSFANKLRIDAADLGADMMSSAAGFVNPTHTVSRVDIVPTDGAHRLVGAGGPNPASSPATLGATILQPGSIASITIISALWALRVYLVLVVLAYARGVLRQHIVLASGEPGHLAEGVALDDPFQPGRELGAGWAGRLGRAMTALGRAFWFGPADEEEERGEWARFGRKFAAGGESSGPPGPVERERRRRAGTGPPVLRPIELEGVRK